MLKRRNNAKGGGGRGGGRGDVVRDACEMMERVAESGCSRVSRRDKTRDKHKLGEFGDCCVRARGNRRGMNNVS